MKIIQKPFIGKRFTIRDIKSRFFSFPKFVKINLAAEILKIDFDKLIEIKIIRHTDNVGEESYNVWLSEKRAEEVSSLFKAYKGKISISGKGASRPLNDNLTDSKRKRNRRVEVILEAKSELFIS